jgi:heat shock protein 4
VDIITNEVSNRATPSLVAFGPKQRSLGEAAKTQETSNFRNTIGSLKRLIGRTATDPEVTEVEKQFLNASLVDVDGGVGTEVKYLGETQKFSATQLVGAYFSKLRDIAAAELKTGVSDVVIAVPGWFSEIQRRALLDAASVAGLNPLRLVNDYAAVALGYGITKSDLPEVENPRNVVFIDVGHSSLSVAVIAFSKGQFNVRSAAFDTHLGGRDIDLALVRHFAAEFKEKYKIDVLANPKATFRLQAACEKLKKVLSANSESPLNVESIMNDVDASSKLTREQLEELIAPVIERVRAPIERALSEAGITVDDVHSVELIGGSSRVPALRAQIQAAFPGKTLQATLNQDEACARGATFVCAMLSPVFKVREFSMHDITPYPVRVQWAPVAGDSDETFLDVFPRGNSVPSTKVLTFYRKDAFDLEAVYADPAGLPGKINPWIGGFTAKKVEAGEDVATVKVKTRINAHGVVNFEAAYVEEVEEREEPAAMEVDASAVGEAPAPPKKKKVVKRKEVPFVTTNTSLEKSILDRYTAQEAEMYASDKLVADTEDRKNALEEYVYDMRGKVEDRYAAYTKPEEKEKLFAALTEAEDWLYSEEGEEATKSVYVERLDKLKVIGDPISQRYREAEERPRTLSSLRETMNEYMEKATSSDERYSHIDEKEKQKIVEFVANTQHWLDSLVARQAERPKNENPVLLAKDAEEKRQAIIMMAVPILSKPKPKPTTTEGTETPKEQKKEEAPPQPDAEEGPTEMDVD